ncbi:MAG: hypothetical protein V4657_11410 [Pseudomonadota bacterium]
MKPDLTQIEYEVNSLAAMVNDKASIARHINAVHGTKYRAVDIETIMAGLKPVDSGPIRSPIAVRQTKLMVEPITWSQPIRTHKTGADPLATAINAYLAKNASKIREALAQ